ncbi:MAG: anti-sigma factor family protein [Streptosporangiaceae bacterium]
MTSHLDADVLADYREGLLDRRRAARIHAHLTGCEQCSRLDAGLAEVTELLASAPLPLMPEHLAARLENALAMEAAVREAETGTAPAGAVTGGAVRREQRTANGAQGSAPGETGQRHRVWRRPDRSPPPRQWRTAWLGAAAAIVLILAVGGVYGLSRLSGGGNSASSSSGAELAPPNSAGSGGQAESPRAPAALPAAALRVTDSGTNYLPGKLAAQARSVLAATDTPALGGLKTGANSKAPYSASDTQLRACASLVTGGVAASLIDEARYQGRPATIIVLAGAGGRPGHVWVAGPGCLAGHRDLIAHAELPAQG